MISELGFWGLALLFVALWLIASALWRRSRAKRSGQVSGVSYDEAFSPWNGGVKFPRV